MSVKVAKMFILKQFMHTPQEIAAYLQYAAFDAYERVHCY